MKEFGWEVSLSRPAIKLCTCKREEQTWLIWLITGIHILKIKYVSITNLQSANRCTLEAQISFEVLCNFSDQTLEGQLANQQLCWLLVPSDFTQSHSSRPVSVRLFHTTCGRGAFAGSLCSQLLSGCLTSGRLSCSLLCTSHPEKESWDQAMVFFLLKNSN